MKWSGLCFMVKCMARPCGFDVVQAHSPHTYLGRDGSMSKGPDLMEGSWLSNDCTRPSRRCSSGAKLGRCVCMLNLDVKVAYPAVQLCESAGDHGPGHRTPFEVNINHISQRGQRKYRGRKRTSWDKTWSKGPSPETDGNRLQHRHSLTMLQSHRT